MANDQYQPPFPFERTARGFPLMNFVDKYGQQCSIQDSSLATDACCWLGVDVDIEGAEVNKRMHLTREMAGKLAAALAYFAEHGTISIEESDHWTNGPPSDDDAEDDHGE